MYKQVIVYRRDLKMRKGKIAAQCAHAAMGVFLRRQVDAERVVVRPRDAEGPPEEGWVALDPDRALVLDVTPEMKAWATGRVKKVVLSVDDEEALHAVHRLAEEAGLPTARIRDAGLTEFGGVPTWTACAVGPADPEAIDRITGKEGAVKTKLA